MQKIKKLLTFGFTLIMILVVVAACAQTAGENPTSEIPTSEVPAGEMPTNEVPTNEVPTSEIPAESTTITMAGSTTIQPLAEKFAEAYMTDHTNVRIDVQGGGSSVGVKAAGEQTANIGMASREVKESELTEFPGINVFTVARDGIAIIGDPNLSVDNLTIEQIKGIFGGTITNWKEVGGEDANIIVVSREEGSGTRAAFEEMVLGEEVLITETAILQPSNGSIRTTISTTPNSIGYLSFGYLDDSIKPVSVEGVAPTEANASNGTYPIVRPLNLITFGEPTGELKAFVDYMLSEAGQAIVVAEGYLAVK